MKKIFGSNLGFQKLFMIFVIGSIFGCYYEMIINLVIEIFKNGKLVWETRSGVLYGPFSIIYGIGIAIITKLFANKNLKWYQIIIFGALFGGICEYVLGYIQEITIGTKSWDYSTHILNFNGRTSIPVMFGWGIGIFIYIRFIYKHLSEIIEKIPYRFGVTIMYILLIFLSIDIFISYSALIRRNLRRHGIPPYTLYGEFLDKNYPDQKLEKAFPKMEYIN